MRWFVILLATTALAAAADTNPDATAAATPSEARELKVKAKEQMADAAEVTRLLNEAEQHMKAITNQLKDNDKSEDKARESYLLASSSFNQLQLLGVTRQGHLRYKTAFDRFIRLTHKMLSHINPNKDAGKTK